MYEAKRIVVTGVTGAGKSTFGEKLSVITQKKIIELDDLYWLPGWKQRSHEEFLELVKEQTDADEWIVIGGYLNDSQEIWSRADLIIWLDTRQTICLYRILKRSLFLWLTKNPCCNNNFETLNRFFGENSVFKKIFIKHDKKHAQYIEHFNHQTSQTPWIRICSNKEMKKVLMNFKPTSSS